MRAWYLRLTTRRRTTATAFLLAGTILITVATAAGGVFGYWFVTASVFAGWLVGLFPGLTGKPRRAARVGWLAAVFAGGAAAAGAVQPLLVLVPTWDPWDRAKLTAVMVAAAASGVMSLWRLGGHARVTETSAPEAPLVGWLGAGARRALPPGLIVLSAVSTWWHLGLITGWGRGIQPFFALAPRGDVAPALGIFLGMALGSERSRQLAAGSVLGLTVSTVAVSTGVTAELAAIKWEGLVPAMWVGALGIWLSGTVLGFGKRARGAAGRRWTILLVPALIAGGAGLMVTVLPWVTSLAASTAALAGTWLGRLLGRNLGFAAWPAAALSLGLGTVGITFGMGSARILEVLDHLANNYLANMQAVFTPALLQPGLMAVTAGFVAGAVISMAVATTAQAVAPTATPVTTPLTSPIPRVVVASTVATLGAVAVLLGLDFWWKTLDYPWGTTLAGGPDRTAVLARTWSVFQGGIGSFEQLGVGAAIGLVALLLPGGGGFFLPAGLLFWPGSVVWVLAGAWVRSRLEVRDGEGGLYVRRVVKRFSAALLVGFVLGGVLAVITAVVTAREANAATAGWPWFAADVVLGVSLTLFLHELAGRRRSAANTSVGRTGRPGQTGRRKFGSGSRFISTW